MEYLNHSFNFNCQKEDECELPICLDNSCNEHSSQRFVNPSLSKVLQTKCQYNKELANN